MASDWAIVSWAVPQPSESVESVSLAVAGDMSHPEQALLR